MIRLDNQLASPGLLSVLSTGPQKTAEDRAVPRAWQVRYRNGTHEQVAAFHTSDDATEAACHLLDYGDDVIAIGEESVVHAIEREEITLIYSRWARAKHD